jgi:quercetin dioxygenase-like cupin family protein
VGIYSDGGRSIWLMGMLITFKAVSEETGGEYSLYELTVPPQLGAPPHIHHRETEAYYVLDGEVEFLRGEHTVTARVGAFAPAPSLAYWFHRRECRSCKGTGFEKSRSFLCI